jgi:hypothetical protein
MKIFLSKRRRAKKFNGKKGEFAFIKAYKKVDPF